ncbi:MAG: hypothetical protein ACPHID_01715 [Thermoplasmatota archaeon]
MIGRFATITLALAVALAGTGAANFNDNQYHEYILYEVDTSKIDVLIVPSASPYALRDNTILRQGVDAWDAGIDDLADAWLANGIEIRTYVLGEDIPPAEALFDPEIIIVSAEYNPVLLFGIGLQVPISWCHNIGPGGGNIDWREELIASPDFHSHGGSWGMLQAQCADGGKQCIVLNTNFLWLPDADNRRNMYDLNTHEVGHCLGIGHVGDALDFTARNFPQTDIMSYQHGNHVHCVSTLNVKALEAVYGGLLGKPGLAQSAGTFVHMNPADYDQHDCDEPTAGLFG